MPNSDERFQHTTPLTFVYLVETQFVRKMKIKNWKTQLMMRYFNLEYINYLFRDKTSINHEHAIIGDI